MNAHNVFSTVEGNMQKMDENYHLIHESTVKWMDGWMDEKATCITRFQDLVKCMKAWCQITFVDRNVRSLCQTFGLRIVCHLLRPNERKNY